MIFIQNISARSDLSERKRNPLYAKIARCRPLGSAQISWRVYISARSMSTSTIKAVYNYSYDYEGIKVAFRKGEEFQLLQKTNQEWWLVRRWKSGSAQDFYVPAVYVKEIQGEFI